MPFVSINHGRDISRGIKSQQKSGRVGSGWVGSGRVGSGRVGSGPVGSDRVGSGRVGSGWVGIGIRENSDPNILSGIGELLKY